MARQTARTPKFFFSFIRVRVRRGHNEFGVWSLLSLYWPLFIVFDPVLSSPAGYFFFFAPFFEIDGHSCFRCGVKFGYRWGMMSSSRGCEGETAEQGREK